MVLAQSCGRAFELLEVTYEVVDVWFDRVERAGAPFDQLLMLGLRGDGTTFYLEQFARNEIGITRDVRGVVRGPRPIEADGPPLLAGTLFTGPAGPFPLSPVHGGEGRGEGPIPEYSQRSFRQKPLTPALSPEYRGEGVERLVGASTYACSDNAGCYLCNYVYYRALRRFPGKRVGFVHVPPLEVVPLDAQRERLMRLLNALEAE
jgi:hypothetical protein